MARFKPVKKTSFLEAVAACIEHERQVFDFYVRNAESLPAGAIKDLFYELAENQDEHIQLIGEIYAGVNGGAALPNLKMASQVEKLNSTSLQILMRRIDRITQRDAGGVEMDALGLATKEHEDASEFYGRMAARFESPDIRYLFHKLAAFQDECRLLLENFSAYRSQGTPQSQPSGYWDLEP